MSGAAGFVADLVGEMREVFSRLEDADTLTATTEGPLDVAPLLRFALASELEAAELAGTWLPTTPEVEGKILFAEQCADEMKHYRLIADRLVDLGHDRERLAPSTGGRSPLYSYLRDLRTTVERVAGGLFASEAVAVVRNVQFIRFCRSVGDEATARLYEETIHPDESRHHQLGRRFLERWVTGDESRRAAAAVVRNTLAIADELRTLAERRTGGGPIPAS